MYLKHLVNFLYAGESHWETEPMNTSWEIVSACMEKLGGITPHAVAEHLGVQASQVYAIRAGKLSASKTICKNAAKILGVEYAALYAIACAERENDGELKASLLKMAKASIAAVIVLCITAPPAAMEAARPATDLYIMSNNLGAALARLVARLRGLARALSHSAGPRAVPA